jgi:hypothetical protein
MVIEVIFLIVFSSLKCQLVVKAIPSRRCRWYHKQELFSCHKKMTQAQPVNQGSFSHPAVSAGDGPSAVPRRAGDHLPLPKQVKRGTWIFQRPGLPAAPGAGNAAQTNGQNEQRRPLCSYITASSR